MSNYRPPIPVRPISVKSERINSPNIPPLHPTPVYPRMASPLHFTAQPTPSRATSAHTRPSSVKVEEVSVKVKQEISITNLTMPKLLSREIRKLMLDMAVEEASSQSRNQMLCSASLISKDWMELAQESLCQHVVIKSQTMANKWVQSEATARYPILSLEIDGRYNQVSHSVTENILIKTRGLERLRIDLVQGLSSKIFVFQNTVDLKRLVLHCKILCDPMPLLIPFHLTHLTLGGSYFPLALTRALFSASHSTLKHLVLTFQTQHSLDLRDLILSCLNSLPALESLTDWCRPSADFFLLLPNLPPSLVTLNTCFSDTIQIPTVTRALSLVTLPNLKTFRFLYFSKADLETNNVGIQLLAWFRGKGVTVEYGFERRDLREEHLLSKTEALRVCY